MTLAIFFTVSYGNRIFLNIFFLESDDFLHTSFTKYLKHAHTERQTFISLSNRYACFLRNETLIELINSQIFRKQTERFYENTI